MSSNHPHKISIHNYEEWLILYMDNELSAVEKNEVDAFLLLHPQLRNELDLLLGTQLPAENVVFSGKEELLASAMKLNTVDESLLLYIDNELTAAEIKKVEEQLSVDKDLRLQYELLQKTKMNAAEVISYPDKKELYRYTERRIFPAVWMRIAAAVIVLLTGGYLFLPGDGATDTVTSTEVAVIQTPAETKKSSTPASPEKAADVAPQQDQVVTITTATKTDRIEKKVMPVLPVKENVAEQPATAQQTVNTTALAEWDAVQVDVKKLVTQPTVALNNSIANLRVTSVIAPTYNHTEDPEELAVTDGDDKQNHRTPAKGFLRKISRFIERRTGIGTVNADDELLVGSVALKLN